MTRDTAFTASSPGPNPKAKGGTQGPQSKAPFPRTHPPPRSRRQRAARLGCGASNGAGTHAVPAQAPAPHKVRCASWGVASQSNNKLLRLPPPALALGGGGCGWATASGPARRWRWNTLHGHSGARLGVLPAARHTSHTMACAHDGMQLTLVLRALRCCLAARQWCVRKRNGSSLSS